MNIESKYRVEPGSEVDLSTWKTDDADGVDRDQIEAQTEANTLAISELQHKLYAQQQRSVLIVLQAMDAAGKDSTIRRVFGRVNPQGVQVTSFKRPTEDERAHDFLWRIHQHTPRRGHIAIFNRSHYEDVLVARVDDLVKKDRWSKRYDIINGFEQGLVNGDTEIVKIYLHLSKDRQKQKLTQRLTDPTKNWKFEAGDISTRSKWDQYMTAYQDAISICNTNHAPWYIVPTDRKWYRVFVISEIVRATLESINPQFPDPKLDPASAMKLLEQIT
ncbi:MAG: polyphosphate kinase 2 family protein [Phycisphaerales bacterium]|nr:polyphosphate kinase 2 family protein [Phycisphaerales bacterium]